MRRRKGTIGTPVRIDMVSFVARNYIYLISKQPIWTHCSGARRASVAV
jgi:hypothetical protein